MIELLRKIFVKLTNEIVMSDYSCRITTKATGIRALSAMQFYLCLSDERKLDILFQQC